MRNQVQRFHSSREGVLQKKWMITPREEGVFHLIGRVGAARWSVGIET